MTMQCGMWTLFCAALAIAGAACGGGAANTPAGAPTTSNATAGSPLEGKSFDVTLEMPGEQPQKDTLTFAAGKFESSECTTRGFPKGAAYSAKPDGDGVDFQVKTRHPEGVTVDWKGKTKGSSVEGTWTRTMSGKTDVGTFKGEPRR